jgi:hypothetical protein
VSFANEFGDGSLPGDDSDRHAMATLLEARGELRGAAVVAASELRCDMVDQWDGGQYEIELAVPPQLYDASRGDLFEPLRSAAEAIVSACHFRGLRITVRRMAHRPGWDAELFNRLAAVVSPESARDDHLELREIAR